MKPHPPNTQGRARRKHGGEQGHPEEAESHPEEAERRKRKRTETAEERRREGWGDGRGSAAARPTLTRDWGGPQVSFYSRGKPREWWHGNFIRRTQPHREPPTRPNWAL